MLCVGFALVSLKASLMGGRVHNLCVPFVPFLPVFVGQVLILDLVMDAALCM